MTDFRYFAVAKESAAKQNLEKNISFRLTPDLLALLEAYAKAQLDEQGRSLSVGQAARRLVVNAIQKKEVASS